MKKYPFGRYRRDLFLGRPHGTYSKRDIPEKVPWSQKTDLEKKIDWVACGITLFLFFVLYAAFYA